MNKTFQRYSKYQIHFYTHNLPKILELALLEKATKRFSILDLGCGDGSLLFSLQCQGFLKNAELIVGVDLSNIRIRRLTEKIKRAVGIVSDACNIKELKNKCFDVIICSQLIEHVPSESALLSEMKRLLKDDGYIYISSVIRKPNAFWLYKVDNELRLDPTHVREYPSEEAFLKLLEKEGFYPVNISSSKVKYSFIDLVIRFLIKIRLYNPESARTVFLRINILNRFRNLLKVPIPGYEIIEVLAHTC